MRRLILLNDNLKDKSSLTDKMHKRVYQHLYIPEAVLNADTYIYFDYIVPKMTETVKDVVFIFQIMENRRTSNNDVGIDGTDYVTTRYDAISDKIEEIMTSLVSSSAENACIGRLSLTDIDLMVDKNFVGRVLTFSTSIIR